MPKPTSPKSIALRSQPSTGPVPERTSRPRPTSEPSPEPVRPNPPVLSRRVLVGGGAIAAVVAGGAAWALQGGDGSGSPTPPPSDVAGNAGATAPASAPPTPTQAPTVVPTTMSSPTPAAVTADSLIVESTIADIRAALDSGDVTIVDLVQASLDRIAGMDGDDTDFGLHAVIETNPDALAIATTLDEELRNGQSRGPLHGIPVLVKDVFASADGLKTAAGSLALAENTVVEDSFVVQRLREAGIVLLGKANMSEWAGFRSSGLGSGWSGRGGQAVNPYQLDKSPWGSSSGSAIAVAASYVPLALGTETDGSIVCPASACGVVGLKPTVGLVSRRGVIPIGFSQDSPGPFGRTVRDVALLLSAIAGFDDEDPSNGEFADSAPASEFDSSPIQAPGDLDYTATLDENALNGKRIGVARSLFGWDASADAMMEETIATLQAAGAEIVDDLYFEGEFDVELEYVVLITEFAYGTQQFFDRFMPDGPIASLADVIAFNDDHAAEELDFGDQVVLERALDVGPIDDPGYEDARATMHRATRQDGIDAMMDAAGIDALIAPTAPVPAEVSSYGDPGFAGSSATPAAMAGYPSISIPIGLVDNLPVGMNIFGRAFSERTLLEIAYGCEQILRARVPPSYLPADPTDDPTPEEEVDGDPASSPEEDPTTEELDPSELDTGL